MARRKSWHRTQFKKYGKRPFETREVKPRILIVCEGLKTEPNYFKSFRIKSADIQIFGGKGVHKSVVNTAMKIRDEDGPYDEVWCVFDRDVDPRNKQHNQNFDDAIKSAENDGIKVAYSVDAFELWYVLHFNYMDNALSRSDYTNLLNNELGRYEKNDVDMYAKLESKQNDAIRNAKKLFRTKGKIKPSENDPVTTVHKLVERLNKLK